MSSFSNSGALFTNAALYSGLVYLQGMVTSSLLRRDLPAAAAVDDRGGSLSQRTRQQETLLYYKSRSSNDVSYKVVPVACVSLTLGVFGNLYYAPSRVASLSTLAVAFLTAFNNGKNVVNPINGFKANNDDEKAVASLLAQVRWGHWMDFLGFTTIFFLSLLR